MQKTKQIKKDEKINKGFRVILMNGSEIVIIANYFKLSDDGGTIQFFMGEGGNPVASVPSGCVVCN